MLFEQARYIERINAQQILVETRMKTTCNACQHNQNCGTGVIARAFSGKTNKVIALAEHDIADEQIVTLQISEQNLIEAALLLYALPLFFIIVFAFVSHYLFAQQDVAVILGAFLGGYVGFRLCRFYSGKITQLPKVVEQLGVQTFDCDQGLSINKGK